MLKQEIVLKNKSILNQGDDICFKYDEASNLVEFVSISNAILNSGTRISIDNSSIEEFLQKYITLCGSRDLFVEESSLKKEANSEFFKRNKDSLLKVKYVNITDNEVKSMKDSGTNFIKECGSDEDKKAVLMAIKKKTVHFTSAYHEFKLLNANSAPCYFILDQQQLALFKKGIIPSKILKIKNSINILNKK